MFSFPAGLLIMSTKKADRRAFDNEPKRRNKLELIYDTGRNFLEQKALSKIETENTVKRRSDYRQTEKTERSSKMKEAL